MHENIATEREVSHPDSGERDLEAHVAGPILFVVSSGKFEKAAGLRGTTGRV